MEGLVNQRLKNFFLDKYINQQNETKHNLFSLDVPEGIKDLTLKVQHY